MVHGLNWKVWKPQLTGHWRGGSIQINRLKQSTTFSHMVSVAIDDGTGTELYSKGVVDILISQTLISKPLFGKWLS